MERTIQFGAKSFLAVASIKIYIRTMLHHSSPHMTCCPVAMAEMPNIDLWTKMHTSLVEVGEIRVFA